jgi:hypothetical protein
MLCAELGAIEGGNGDGAVSEDVPLLAVPASEAFALSRIVLVALLAWLAIPPVAAAAVGLRRLRNPGASWR